MSATMTRDRRSKEEKIRLFRRYFTGLEEVYGTYDPQTGRSWQVKAPVTDKVILSHLSGRRPYGVYLLTGERTRAAVADFDEDNAMLPREFVFAAAHYGIPAYIERSRSKGYHVWVFFAEDGVTAAEAKTVMHHILEETGDDSVEVFPKQDRLPPSGTTYGNFINAPLFGRSVQRGRTVFVTRENPYEPYANQWQFLEEVQEVSREMLDEIIVINDLASRAVSLDLSVISIGPFEPGMNLPPCARRMLEEGVRVNQRVACFRLAVHLRRMGLPFDLVVATLGAWALKNRPLQGKRTITETEIKAQTASAFLKEYRGHGCEDPAVAPFCDATCPVKSQGQVCR